MKKSILKFSILAMIAIMLTATSCVKTNSNVDSQELRQIVTEAIHSAVDTDSISRSTVIFSNSEVDSGERDVMLTAIIFGTTTGVLIVVLPIFFICYFIYRKRTIRYRIIEKAIDNNMQLPDSFFNDDKDRPQRSRLQSALVWIAWGMGIALFFLIADSEEAIAIGIIPMLVGVAKLITYLVEDRKKDNQDAEQI